jgi:hypothetical protein
MSEISAVRPKRSDALEDAIACRGGEVELAASLHDVAIHLLHGRARTHEVAVLDRLIDQSLADHT